jgi:hypothetical protein
MAIFQGGVELVYSDSRRTQLAVVATHAILREEGFHHLVKRWLQRVWGASRRLSQKETRCQRHSETGKQTEGEYGVQSNPTSP